MNHYWACAAGARCARWTACIGVAISSGIGCAGAPLYAEMDRRLAALEAAPAAAAAASPFAGQPVLERHALVAEVLRRNPGIAAARHAWRAALARYPQQTSLADPMLGYGLGPRSFSSGEVADAHRVELSQELPFPGKLALRGAAALAEAEAAAHDYEAVRLRLASMASMLFDEYWLLARKVEITERHLELLGALRRVAASSYEAGIGTQQDPLRAEVEEAELLHRRVELGAALRVTRQQLALLLHLRDGSALPPPPDELAPVEVVEVESDTAAVDALASRPELRAAGARVAAKQAGVSLARREFLPDLKVVGMYDGFWDVGDLQPFVGIELNVPLRQGRRRAALVEARAMLGEAEQERLRMQDEVETEVRSALERWQEARHLLEIARDRLVPATRDRLAAARTGFETGGTEFRDVIEAERAWRDAELAEREALAETSRRAAELAAARGQIPSLEPESAAGEAVHGGDHD